MDPSANVMEALVLAKEMLAVCESQEAIDANRMPDVIDIARLCELVIARDAWESKGGFRPPFYP